MKKPTLALLALLALIFLSSCENPFDYIGSKEEEKEQVQEEIILEKEENNALSTVERERDLYRSALKFERTRKNFSEAELAIIDLPGNEMKRALECYQKCNSGLLYYVGLESCGLTTDLLKEVTAQIDDMFCVPFKIRFPKKKERNKKIQGIENYDQTSSLVYCYRTEGDLIFHIKKMSIVQVYR